MGSEGPRRHVSPDPLASIRPEFRLLEESWGGAGDKHSALLVGLGYFSPKPSTKVGEVQVLGARIRLYAAARRRIL